MSRCDRSPRLCRVAPRIIHSGMSNKGKSFLRTQLHAGGDAGKRGVYEHGVDPTRSGLSYSKRILAVTETLKDSVGREAKRWGSSRCSKVDDS